MSACPTSRRRHWCCRSRPWAGACSRSARGPGRRRCSSAGACAWRSRRATRTTPWKSVASSPRSGPACRRWKACWQAARPRRWPCTAACWAWPGPGRRSIRWPACRPSKRSTSSTCGVATSRCWTGWSAPSSRSARATAACRSSRRNRCFPCACPIRRRASAWWSACGCPPAPANKRRLTGWSAPSSPPIRTCRCSPGSA